MTTRKYTIGRPSQDVRLRNWPAGKVAQLKNAIQVLEDQLNTAMATQIAQGDKRVFNSRVPKVVNIVVSAGFKNFQLHFDEAKGISDLLFYEIQKDTSSSFPNPTTQFTTQTSITIPTTTERENVNFRVRVVNSKFEFGPWSSTASATGSSNFRITVTRKDRQTVNITWVNRGTWVDVAGVDYTPTNASTFLNLHAGVNTTVATSATDELNNTNCVIFRILRNGVEFTNAGRMTVISAANFTLNDATYDNRIFEEAQIGTLITPMESFLGNESTVSYTLQAMIDSTRSSRNNATHPASPNNADAVIIIDLFDVVEIVEAVNGNA